VGDYAGVPYDFWAIHQFDDFVNLFISCHN
jgi:hypothetical protein